MLVIAFAQPRLGSLEVMKSRSPGQENYGFLMGPMCRQGYILQRKVWAEARAVASHVGPGSLSTQDTGEGRPRSNSGVAMIQFEV